MKIIRYVAFMAIAVIMAMTTSCGGSDKVINATIEEINKQLEGQKMPGIEKMSLSADEDYIIYNYLVDEDQVNINEMGKAVEEQKEQLKKDIINNPDQQKFIQLVKFADRGMKFSYKGNKSGETYEVVFENDEL